jgi:hypothetical protein
VSVPTAFRNKINEFKAISKDGVASINCSKARDASTSSKARQRRENLANKIVSWGTEPFPSATASLTEFKPFSTSLN